MSLTTNNRKTYNKIKINEGESTTCWHTANTRYYLKK